MFEELRLEPPTTIHSNERRTESYLDLDRLREACARGRCLGFAALRVVRAKEKRNICTPSRCGTLLGGSVVLGVDGVLHVHLLPATASGGRLRRVKVDILHRRRFRVTARIGLRWVSWGLVTESLEPAGELSDVPLERGYLHLKFDDLLRGITSFSEGFGRHQRSKSARGLCNSQLGLSKLVHPLLDVVKYRDGDLGCLGGSGEVRHREFVVLVDTRLRQRYDVAHVSSREVGRGFIICLLCKIKFVLKILDALLRICLDQCQPRVQVINLPRLDIQLLGNNVCIHREIFQGK